MQPLSHSDVDTTLPRAPLSPISFVDQMGRQCTGPSTAPTTDPRAERIFPRVGLDKGSKQPSEPSSR